MLIVAPRAFVQTLIMIKVVLVIQDRGKGPEIVYAGTSTEEAQIVYKTQELLPGERIAIYYNPSPDLYRKQPQTVRGK